jgi:hypothetical protein
VQKPFFKGGQELDTLADTLRLALVPSGTCLSTAFCCSRCMSHILLSSGKSVMHQIICSLAAGPGEGLLGAAGT